MAMVIRKPWVDMLTMTVRRWKTDNDMADSINVCFDRGINIFFSVESQFALGIFALDEFNGAWESGGTYLFLQTEAPNSSRFFFFSWQPSLVAGRLLRPGQQFDANVQGNWCFGPQTWNSCLTSDSRDWFGLMRETAYEAAQAFYSQGRIKILCVLSLWIV